MKNPSRLLLALLAVAGSSAVLAQSSVTLYGRVNTTVERQKAGDQTSTQMVNNSSRFGFRGVEDLGGGLKAGHGRFGQHLLWSPERTEPGRKLWHAAPGQFLP